jgi:hypothetical protein
MIHTVGLGVSIPTAIIILTGTKADNRKGKGTFSPVSGCKIAETTKTQKY